MNFWDAWVVVLARCVLGKLMLLHIFYRRVRGIDAEMQEKCTGI